MTYKAICRIHPESCWNNYDLLEILPIRVKLVFLEKVINIFMGGVKFKNQVKKIPKLKYPPQIKVKGKITLAVILNKMYTFKHLILRKFLESVYLAVAHHAFSIFLILLFC